MGQSERVLPLGVHPFRRHALGLLEQIVWGQDKSLGALSARLSVDPRTVYRWHFDFGSRGPELSRFCAFELALMAPQVVAPAELGQLILAFKGELDRQTPRWRQASALEALLGFGLGRRSKWQKSHLLWPFRLLAASSRLSQDRINRGGKVNQARARSPTDQ